MLNRDKETNDLANSLLKPALDAQRQEQKRLLLVRANSAKLMLWINFLALTGFVAYALFLHLTGTKFSSGFGIILLVIAIQFMNIHGFWRNYSLAKSRINESSGPAA